MSYYFSSMMSDQAVAGSFVGAMFLFMIVVVILVLAFAVFWIWTIIDVARREFTNPNERLIWLLLIVLLGIIPSVIYYFFVMHPNNKGCMKKGKK